MMSPPCKGSQEDMSMSESPGPVNITLYGKRVTISL